MPYIECSKCETEYPNSFESCPICCPTKFELQPFAIVIMIIMIIALALGIYYAG